MSRRFRLVVLAIGLTIGCCSITGATTAATYYDGTLESFKNFISANKANLDKWVPPAELAIYHLRDGTALRYARWEPVGEPQNTVVYFSGRTEFIERNTRTYSDLAAKGWRVWTFDWRGQGLSGLRLEKDSMDPFGSDRALRGHIDDFDTYVRDATEFVENKVNIKGEPGKHVLLAHSMGGQIALRYLQANADDFNVVVLSSPLVKLPMTWGQAVGEAVKDAFGPRQPCVLNLNYYFNWGDDRQWHNSFSRPGTACEALSRSAGALLKDDENTHKYTHDVANLAAGECLVEQSLVGGGGRPGLAVTCPTAGWVIASKNSTDAVLEGGVRIPILIVAANDSIVDPSSQEKYCAKAPNCTFARVPAAGHELLIEEQKFRDAFLQCFYAFTKDPTKNGGGKICQDAVNALR